jgi:hypothetical protein
MHFKWRKQMMSFILAKCHPLVHKKREEGLGCEVALTNRVVTFHEERLAGEIRGAAAEPTSAVPPATTMFFSVLMG